MATPNPLLATQISFLPTEETSGPNKLSGGDALGLDVFDFMNQNLVFPEDLGNRLDLRHFMQIVVSDRGRKRFIEPGSNNVDTSEKILGRCYLPITPVANSFGAGWSGISGGMAGNFFFNQGAKYGQDYKTVGNPSPLGKAHDVAVSIATNSLESVVDGDIVTTIQNGINRVAMKAVAFSPIGQQFQAGAKVAVRDFQHQMFDSMGFREFSFNWSFVAKSREESFTLRKIERLLKFGMHPSYGTADKTVLDYPSDFYITFNAVNVETDKNIVKNVYYPQMGKCVLTSLNFTYNPSVTSFRTDNSPLEIAMSLSFRETEIISREQIETGARS